ncbi:MAG: LLM class flavin-dependent oxidoreductase [Deltaproteobacteria bacterium]|nr:LLM class flavin-dependent oxidoreductase [Deltaproteobacteria bacterium]
MALTACALSTSRIRLGPGVTHTATRHPSVVACGFASLAEVAPGRIDLAIGFGDSAIRGLGGKPVRLAKYREDFELIRRLLAGEKVPYNGREVKLAWSDARLTRQIPLYVVPGGGPKGLTLAGELGQGVVLHSEEEEIAERMGHIASGAKKAGKTLKDVDIIWWPTASISDDWSKVREHLAPRIASGIRHAYYDYKRGSIQKERLPVPLELARQVAEEYNFLEHATAGAEHSKLLDQVPDKVFREGHLAGSPREVAETVRRVVDTYPEIRQVVLHIPVGTARLSLGDILRSFATEVKPLLR